MSTLIRPIRTVPLASRQALAGFVIAGALVTGGGQPLLAAAPDGPPLVRSHGPIVQPDDHPTEAPSGLAWKAPSTWTSTTPKNPMRKAQYSLPAAAGDPAEAECVVFFFGAGQGGDVQGNIDRWRSMFTTPDGGPAPYKVGEMKVGSRQITKMEASGTYLPTQMGPGSPVPEPKPGWMMLGAVVPGSDANWFFRCAGPKKTIEAERSNFEALLATIR